MEDFKKSIINNHIIWVNIYLFLLICHDLWSIQNFLSQKKIYPKFKYRTNHMILFLAIWDEVKTYILYTISKPIFLRGDYKTEIKLEWVGLYIGYVANAIRIHKQGSNSKDSWTTNSTQSRSDTLPLQTTPRYFFKWPIYHQRKFLEEELCTKSVFLRASAVANQWPKNCVLSERLLMTDTTFLTLFCSFSLFLLQYF